jgi:hypothetical protein
MNKKRRTSFFDLTPEQRDREVARFDREIDLSETRPLTKQERLRFERGRKAKLSVSIFVNNGYVDVKIHLDEELMTQARAYAKKYKTSLPRMIERGLQGLLAFGR